MQVKINTQQMETNVETHFVEVVDAGASGKVQNELARRILFELMLEDADHHDKFLVRLADDVAILQAVAQDRISLVPATPADSKLTWRECACRQLPPCPCSFAFWPRP